MKIFDKIADVFGLDPKEPVNDSQAKKDEDTKSESEEKSEEKSEEDSKEESKDDTKDGAPENSDIMARVKKLVDSDEKALEELLPYFEKYVGKHHAYREVIVAAPPRRKLEIRYSDRLNPGSTALLKSKEVESIVKKDYDKEDREVAKKMRFKEVICYADGTPASKDDVAAWQAKTPTPEETPGDGSSGGDSSAA